MIVFSSLFLTLQLALTAAPPFPDLSALAIGRLNAQDIAGIQSELGRETLVDLAIQALDEDPRFGPGTPGERNILLLLTHITDEDGRLYLADERVVNELMHGLRHSAPAVRFRMAEVLGAPAVPARFHAQAAETLVQRLPAETDHAVLEQIIRSALALEPVIDADAKRAVSGYLWTVLEDPEQANPALRTSVRTRIDTYELMPMPEEHDHVHPRQVFYEHVALALAVFESNPDQAFDQFEHIDDDHKRLAIERALVRSVMYRESVLYRVDRARRVAVLDELADALTSKAAHRGFVKCCVEGIVHAVRVDAHDTCELVPRAQEVELWFEQQVRPAFPDLAP